MFREYTSAARQQIVPIPRFNFTNWLWREVVRVKLEESKGDVESFQDDDVGAVVDGADAVSEVLSEFLPEKKVVIANNGPVVWSICDMEVVVHL